MTVERITKLLGKKIELSGKSDGNGTIQGYACVWDQVDEDGDIIRKGSFARAMSNQIKAGAVLLMARHIANGGDAMEAIGKITVAKEDENGFWIEAELFDAQNAQEMRKKILDAPEAFGMSIGWDNRGSVFSDIDGGKEYKEINLKEVTITMLPAQTGTIGTVSAKESVKAKIAELEARLVALEGKTVSTEADESADTADSIAPVQRNYSAEIARQKRILTLIERGV